MKTPASRFTSPLRGPWLTSVFGLALLVALPIIILTGLLSYIAYGPQLGQAIPADVGWLRLPLFAWPTRPSWLYRLTQGLHVGLGLVIIPVVLAKLWSVIPKLFAWPPARTLAQLIERVSLLLLVGGLLFEIVTGVLNIQYDYIFGFSFYDAHYFGAWVFITGFLMHIALKIPHMVTGLRSLSWREVLRTNVTDTRAQPPDDTGLVAAEPADRQPPRRTRPGRLRRLAARGADRRADARRTRPQRRPARSPRARPGLPGQQDRVRRRHHAGGGGSRMAIDAAGRAG